MPSNINTIVGTTNRVNRWQHTNSTSINSYTDRDISGGVSAREIIKHLFGLEVTVDIQVWFEVS